MSIIFTTLIFDTICMCADKLAVHLKTSETHTVSKIEMWAPTIAVGGVGCAALDEIIMTTVHDYVQEAGFENFQLEEIADLFCQSYYAARDEYSDMPKETHAKFVIAGKLSTGFTGAIQVVVGDDEAETEVYESRDVPQTLILSPSDMDDSECNLLFQKAIRSTKSKNPAHHSSLETAHRKAVRYVAEYSKFVGPKSDYFEFSTNGK